MTRALADAILRLEFVGWWLGQMASLGGRGLRAVLRHGPNQWARDMEVALRLGYAGWWVGVIVGLTWRGTWAVLRHGPRGLVQAAEWVSVLERRCAGS